jgi:hypothetical protein
MMGLATVEMVRDTHVLVANTTEAVLVTVGFVVVATVPGIWFTESASTRSPGRMNAMTARATIRTGMSVFLSVMVVVKV